MKTKYFGNKSGENNILIEDLEWDEEEKNKGNADCIRQMSCLDAGVSEKREYEQIKICEISDKRYRPSFSSIIILFLEMKMKTVVQGKRLKSAQKEHEGNIIEEKN